MRDSRNREGHLREEAHPSSSAAAGVRCWAARPAAAQAPAARGLDARPPAAAVGVRWVRPAAVQAAAAAHRLGARPRAPRPEAELQCRLDLCRTPGSCLSCSARRMRRRCAGWPAAPRRAAAQYSMAASAACLPWQWEPPVAAQLLEGVPRPAWPTARALLPPALLEPAAPLCLARQLLLLHRHLAQPGQAWCGRPLPLRRHLQPASPPPLWCQGLQL